MSDERRDKVNIECNITEYLRNLGYNISNKKLEIMIEKCFCEKESIYLAIKNKKNKSQLAFIYFDHFSKLETKCRIKAVIVENKNENKNIATSIVEFAKRIKYSERRDNKKEKNNEYKKYEYIDFNIDSFKFEGKLKLKM